jgi:hypothetical protein
MAAPTYLPEVDTNGTNQPADPAGIPQAIKDDGFLEKQNVPNAWWNWLFKTILAWIVYLNNELGVAAAFVAAHAALLAKRGYVMYREVNGGAGTVIATSPQTFATYTIPAGTLDERVLRITAACAATTSPGAATNMGLVIRLDGNFLARVVPVSGTLVGDNSNITLEIHSDVEDVAASPRVQWQGAYQGDAFGTPTYEVSGASMLPGSTVDTTGDLDLTVEIEMTPDAATKALLRSFVVELLGEA